MADEVFIGYQGWNPNPEAADKFVATLPWKSFAEAIGGITTEDGNSFLWRAMQEALKVDRIHSRNQGQIGSCFPAGTLVLGERTKPIQDVRVGDRVWTGEGKLTDVITTRSLNARQLVRIKPVGGLPLTCTPDHKILVYRMAKVAGKRVNCANYARAKDGSLKGSGNRAAVIKCYEAREPVWVRADSLEVTDCLLSPVSYEPISASSHILSDWMLGYFVGNGHASGGSVEWATPAHKPHITERVCRELGDAGLSFNARLWHGAYRIRTHSRELVRWFRGQFYDDQKVKVYPGWAVGNEEFLAGLCAADGWTGVGAKHERERGLDSTSLSVIWGANATLIGMGYEPAQCEWTPSGGRHANAKPLYRLVWTDQKERLKVWRDDRFVVRAIDKIEMLEVNQTVYDIGVRDDHHSFIANGYSASNCVGHGTATAIDITAACEIYLKGEPEKWVAQASSAAMYGAGRQIANQLGNWEGSNGSWAAEAVTKYGTLYMLEYPGHDLRTYSESLAREFQRRGLDESLKAEAAKHKMGLAAPVRSGEEAWTALMNGYGVNVCSDVGFQGNRNEKGAIARRGSWGHSMAWIGCLTIDGERYFTVQQSWGDNWCSGPYYPADAPLGSFNISFRDGDAMCRQGDSYAYSGLAGFQRRRSVFDALLGNPLTDVNGKTSVFDSLL